MSDDRKRGLRTSRPDNVESVFGPTGPGESPKGSTGPTPDPKGSPFTATLGPTPFPRVEPPSSGRWKSTRELQDGNDRLETPASLEVRKRRERLNLVRVKIHRLLRHDLPYGVCGSAWARDLAEVLTVLLDEAETK